MNIFTYGSLMYSDIWQSLVEGRYRQAPSLALGYQRVCIKNDIYPVTCVAPRTSSVRGVVYFDVRENDLRQLDHFEGEFYQRRALNLYLPLQATCVAAEAYMLSPRFEHLASGKPWNPRRFSSQNKTRFKNLYHP